ncbi:hypothetical protein WUBG_12835 [Wuchereria bancrofti]|uniref:Uncharacterized protein n=1 Tax=Wuchereria bancrofti TaxID=6293 RepID=J9EGX1_WUCBA|nr:hypothetical protein WUBG_12835 [Wuchereria bancrofti]
MMPQKEEDTTGDDEDDFFGNPLKHLMSKVTAAKKGGSVTRTAINDVKKEDMKIIRPYPCFLKKTKPLWLLNRRL